MFANSPQYRATRHLPALGCAIALSLGASAAAASCFPRDTLVETLSSSHKEELVSRGLRADQALVEIFSTEDGATWTIVQSFPNGTSCVVAAGEFWIGALPAPVKGTPS